MYIHIWKLVKKWDSLAVSVNVWNTLKCFPNIFFNNELIKTNSLPCFCICINRRTILVTILIISSVVLVKREMCKPTKAWRYFRYQIGHAVNMKKKDISFSNSLVVNIPSWTSIERSKNEALERPSFSFLNSSSSG